MADSSTASIMIAAPAAAIAAVITDFPAYPEWVGAVRATEVLKTIPDGPNAGLADSVRFQLDAGVVKDRYRLQYQYERTDGVLTTIAWHLLESQTQQSQDGSYRLREIEGGGTEVTYSLSVELKIPMLGLLKRKAERVIMDTALKELKRRVESGE